MESFYSPLTGNTPYSVMQKHEHTSVILPPSYFVKTKHEKHQHKNKTEKRTRLNQNCECTQTTASVVLSLALNEHMGLSNPSCCPILTAALGLSDLTFVAEPILSNGVPHFTRHMGEVELDTKLLRQYRYAACSSGSVQLDWRGNARALHQGA